MKRRRGGEFKKPEQKPAEIEGEMRFPALHKYVHLGD